MIDALFLMGSNILEDKFVFLSFLFIDQYFFFFINYRINNLNKHTKNVLYKHK